MLIDYNNQESSDIYKLMSQTVIPRPIAWIVTEDNGVINIAPFSYFTPLSSNPPALIVSIGHKVDGEEKDTLRNIKSTKKATICFVDENNLEAMHYSSKSLEANMSEADEFNIKTKKLFDEFPPMIEDVKSAFFCELNQILDIGGKTIPVIVNIKHQFIDESIIKDESKLSLELENIARVGREYATLNKNLQTPKIP
jgi:flavin reductase (DIM6/NTAB) family NADH-FMN oxidoreductase RutF